MIIGIDSNLHTYLLDAIEPEYDPSKDKSGVAPDRLAMIRSFLYGNHPFYLVPKVEEEYSKITDENKRRAHQSVHDVMLLDLTIELSKDEVEERKSRFLKHHKGDKDCQILAEAEVAGLDYLLTRDNDFYKNLKDHSTSVKLMNPTDFWGNVLKIPHGAKPLYIPHETNPLANKEWWKW